MGIVKLYFLSNWKGIDLFVKILVFVKILTQGRRKEEEFQSLEVQEQAPLHLKIPKVLELNRYLTQIPKTQSTGNEMNYRVRTPSHIASSVADFHTWFYISLPRILRFVLSIIFLP